ncbi:hypothetical protein [Mesobacillus selenatarsenatis]|uniref:Uncharacterized protein n=1 Tax=Mesobacillus selenatarsenatis (strain DSM 18680 / JCM 14380 / FERM P-15431 / SF-1) TaxID=1321606 RepID=A0A0A8WX92_MESS1|nr:hypothetical protein [Mesobacillus selenatarsenatis]GAM12243.1 hypothetical protein SAMD00020551_0375 [Mesobacillus selenatarsenatis SF-1]
MNESEFKDIVKDVESEMRDSLVETSVNGFSVEIVYKSSSGKQKHAANMEFDKNSGKCTITFIAYPTASTPNQFIERVQDRMREVLNN